MIYKVDFEGQACKQIKEKAESYQYDLKSVLKGIGLLIADMWLPGDSKPQIAYLLLRYGLRKEYGINENVVLSEGSCGKPYLSNYPFVHFNLSHCDKGVACMISDSAVGIDITSVKKENMSCMYSSMTADEIEKILHAENPAVQFTKFWSLKESYCKCIGMGIDSYIKAIDFSNCIGSVFTRYGKMFQVNEVEGSVLSWCASCESNMLEIDLIELFRGLQ